MEKLFINKTEDTPGVNLDPLADYYEISGRSIPEDATEFFTPVLTWLEEFGNSSKPKMEMVMKMEYFNTATSKLFLDIFTKLESIHKNNGKEMIIHWWVYKDDLDMIDAGEEYINLIKLPIIVHYYEDEA